MADSILISVIAFAVTQCAFCAVLLQTRQMCRMHSSHLKTVVAVNGQSDQCSCCCCCWWCSVIHPLLVLRAQCDNSLLGRQLVRFFPLYHPPYDSSAPYPATGSLVLLIAFAANNTIYGASACTHASRSLLLRSIIIRYLSRVFNCSDRFHLQSFIITVVVTVAVIHCFTNSIRRA